MEQEQVVLTGYVEGVIFRNAENGYSVLDFSSDGKLITAVGLLSLVDPGEELTLKGTWVRHPTFGMQFKVDAFERRLPKTAADMLRYLSGGTVKGIGPATAEKIVSRFGEQTFEIMEHDPLALAQIKGISEEKARQIGESFQKQFAVREIMIYLEKYGMTPSECLSAYKALGANVAERVTENPYCLCGQRIGIGFERADEIASRLPHPVNPLFRERAGVIHIISHNLMNGHTCLPREKIIPPACGLLEVEADAAEAIIDDLIEDKELMQETIDGRDFLFLPYIYLAEKNIADRIRVMLKFPPPKGRSAEADIDVIEARQGIHFEEKQRRAILTAAQQGLLVLTGGPGTGKTTTLNGILDLYEAQGLRVLLAAPTGRAAKRMSDVTGREAKTLHRLLEAVVRENDRNTFARNMENPLQCDAVIVDELSMVDVQLFWGLLDALPLGCRLVMVGDSDQLPPVGAGNVLQDIIASDLLPVVALTEVFRQAMESLIVINAHRIVNGELPVLDRTDRDFFFLQRDTVSSTAATMADLCVNRLPKAYGYDPKNDIQIVCPSRKGEAGTVNLNRILQQMLNPPTKDKAELASGGRAFRVGDKVMQTKNNYDIVWTKDGSTGEGVFNGDIGTILSLNEHAKIMKIDFDDRVALYPFDSVKELEHAYAVTVHKSQGCEFEAVILPVCPVAPQLCYRNLLYTAVTRAKNRMVLVGSPTVVMQMVNNDKKMRRYSALRHFLLKEGDA